ncbi:hypothetical protein [Actinoplanes sp. G11-F43]|uniref:hypothetical protein n=1 Tax=Actinoplanes sp. G11-F43 TaxID=3424130 RepID=UPI003D353B55
MSTVKRWPIVLVRILALTILVQVLAQAALAGGFITGEVGWLTAHSVNGSVVMMTAILLWCATVLLFRPGRGPWWPILFSAVLWWLCTIQIGIGSARMVGIHIFLGSLVLALTSGFTWWALSFRGHR